MISTCDRIGGHRWRVWMGGGKEGVREKRLKEVNKTDGSTVDWENFSVKIISRLRPTAKFKHAKNKITR